MSIMEYAAKFVELAKFYPHYTAETAEFSKCIKLNETCCWSLDFCLNRLLMTIHVEAFVPALLMTI